MRTIILGFSAVLILLAAGTSSASSVRTAGTFRLESTIAFTSTRDYVKDPFFSSHPLLAAEVYLINPDMTNPRRLTDNSSFDGFANLSPDGKKIVLDSARLTTGTACNGVNENNISDLYLMSTDGSEQTLLTRGSSATWSPDGKDIAFHASASYYASGGVDTGCPIRTDPGSATSDSDIFVANVDDLLSGVEQPTNITNTQDQIEDDPDWSSVATAAPQGQRIVFTSHPVTDDTQDSSHAELYLMNADGSDRLQLTHDDFEERAPAWSPDGSRIVYSCRVGPANPTTGIKAFRICVINADGSNIQQLTDESDSASDLTASWSPDGHQILFHRRAGGTGNQQLFLMSQNSDGTWTEPRQMTFGTLISPEGVNNLAHWGELRVKD